MYVIGLNGPPQSGKDTFAAMLALALEEAGAGVPIHQVILAAPIRESMMAMLSLDTKNDALYETAKVFGIKELGGLNLRRLMIDFSEEFMKPKFGEAVWSQLLASRFSKFAPGVIIIRDMGFQFEADFWREWAGPDSFSVIRIHREGKDFSDDSREWVTHTHLRTVRNNLGLNDLTAEARQLALGLADRWTLK